MSAIKGDFIGFTYGGVHSSELGIMRVSNGSRYSETLLPEFSNKTMNVPGANRVDYLGMEYTQKSFPLDIAFDSVTEEQLREMKRLFSSEKPLPLVFDESPYKTWYAKAGGNPSFNYVCFDEEKYTELINYSSEDSNYEFFFGGKIFLKNEEKIKIELEIGLGGGNKISIIENSILQKINPVDIIHHGFFTIEIDFNSNKIEFTNNYAPEFVYGIKLKISFLINKRIYKGEGKIDLVSFYPYAFCEPDFAINYDSTKQPDNYYEWIGTSGLLEEPLEDNTGVYNPGDLEAPFWLKINASSLPEGKIKIGSNSLEWSDGAINNSNLPEDTYIIVDGRNQLIEGYNNNGKTGRIYNHFITSGNWFNIPISKDKSDTFPVGKKPDDSKLYYKILYK